jgi:hypothetical protein
MLRDVEIGGKGLSPQGSSEYTLVSELPNNLARTRINL